MLGRFFSFCGDYGRFLVSWLQVSWQMAWGILKLSRVKPPRITFFGGVRLKHDDKYAKAAYKLAAKLANDDIAVITGGGLGLMEASNCGAQSAQSSAANLGITVEGLEREELQNTCSKDLIVMKYFFARKWLLIGYSNGFVIFPGGFGTIDEFAEVVTLLQTKKLKKVPVILYGTEYWQGFIRWMKESALACSLVSQQDIDLITVSDDIDQIWEMLRVECRGDCDIK